MKVEKYMRWCFDVVFAVCCTEMASDTLSAEETNEWYSLSQFNIIEVTECDDFAHFDCRSRCSFLQE